METFFFAVPYRLVWDNWQKFNGEQDNPGDSTDFTVPVISPTQAYPPGSLYDYMGIPTGIDDGLTINSLHFRAYNLIWVEWFRDQNLQQRVTLETGDSGDNFAEYNLLRRGKRHDYFTSCLPFPQKGESVSIPLGTQAPITGIGWPDTVNPVLSNQLALETDNPVPVNYPFAVDSDLQILFRTDDQNDPARLRPC